MAAIQTKAELLQALRANASGIRDFGVLRLGLFGSFARDNAGPESDVDLLVEFATGSKTLKNLVGLSRHLEEKLGRKVELVTREALNELTGKYIVQEVEYVSLAA
jgi:uncharacterized protein